MARIARVVELIDIMRNFTMCGELFFFFIGSGYLNDQFVEYGPSDKWPRYDFHENQMKIHIIMLGIWTILNTYFFHYKSFIFFFLHLFILFF